MFLPRLLLFSDFLPDLQSEEVDSDEHAYISWKRMQTLNDGKAEISLFIAFVCGNIYN